jgi:hypothetical protein
VPKRCAKKSSRGNRYIAYSAKGEMHSHCQPANSWQW